MKPVLAKPGISRVAAKHTWRRPIGALGWRPFAQQAADHFFGMAEPEHCSRICPIHPELQCVTHVRQRNGVVLWSPAKCPGGAADCAGAKSGFGDQDTTRAKRSLRKRHCSILRLKTAPTITAKRTFRRLDASMQSNRLDGRQLCACVRFDSHSLLRFTVAAPVWLAERVCHARGIGCGLVDSAAYGHVFEQARTPDRRQTVLPVVELKRCLLTLL